jgi:hypothetical protein
MRTAAVLLAALVLAACGRDVINPGAFTTTGTWIAEAAEYEWELRLTQDRAVIRGTGELRVDADTLPLDVEGEWRYGPQGGPPRVDLVMRSAGFADASFAGTFTARDTLRGTVTGSGFTLPNVEFIRPVQQPAASTSKR